MSLAKNNNKIEVSNFYKHILSLGCDHIKSLKRSSTVKPQQQQSTYTPSLKSPTEETHPDSSPESKATLQKEVSMERNGIVRGNKRRLASQIQQSRSIKRRRA